MATVALNCYNMVNATHTTTQRNNYYMTELPTSLDVLVLVTLMIMMLLIYNVFKGGRHLHFLLPYSLPGFYPLPYANPTHSKEPYPPQPNPWPYTTFLQHLHSHQHYPHHLQYQHPPLSHTVKPCKVPVWKTYGDWWYRIGLNLDEGQQ